MRMAWVELPSGDLLDLDRVVKMGAYVDSHKKTFIYFKLDDGCETNEYEIVNVDTDLERAKDIVRRIAILSERGEPLIRLNELIERCNGGKKNDQ